MCSGEDADHIAPAFTIPSTGTYTVTATRIAPRSLGDEGRYYLSIGADAFFERPTPREQDVRTGAPDVQCDWTVVVSGDWACKAGTSCQDVYDLALEPGVTLGAEVRNVSAESAVRAGVFAPSEGLAGNNALTGDTTDMACWAAGGNAPLPLVSVTEAGNWQVAVGRDDGASSGTTGSYELRMQVSDGYGVVGGRSVDDGAPATQGVECP